MANTTDRAMAAEPVGRRVAFFDTTFRDGEQAPGNDIRVEDKIRIAQQLDDLGVDFIEAGFPVVSQAHFESTEVLSSLGTRARMVVFCRPTVVDMEAAARAADPSRCQIQLLLTGSELHSRHKRHMTADATIQEIGDGVQLARTYGFLDVSLGLEDATRSSSRYLERAVKIGLDSGASTVVIPDTVGCAHPRSIAELFTRTKSYMSAHPAALLSAHMHNDLGLAVANSIEAAVSGADIVQTTICGIGERTGNAAMEEVVANLHYSGGALGLSTSIEAGLLYDTCRTLLDSIAETAWKHKPIVGDLAFSTAAGVHANGIMKSPVTYEHVEPHMFGRQRQVLLSRFSGVSNIRFALDNLGVDYSETEARELTGLVCSDQAPLRFNEATVLLGALRALRAGAAVPDSARAS